MAFATETIFMEDIPFPPDEEYPFTDKDDYLIDEEMLDTSNIAAKLIAVNDVSKIFSHTGQLATLSTSDFAAIKAKLKAHYGKPLNLIDLNKAVKECKLAQRKRKPQTSDRPQVVIGGQLRDVVSASLDTLVKANRDKPFLFVQDSHLVTVFEDEKGKPIIKKIEDPMLKNIMTEVADYVTVKDGKDGETFTVANDPPKNVVSVILDGMNPKDYPFPAIVGISELPIIREDGSIYQVHGYDTLTKQFYAPGNLIIPPIPDKPTSVDVKAALDLIDYWIAGFPFADQASKATAIGILITAVIRSLIKGQVPLVLLDSPKQGSGKTILAQGVGIVATGRVIGPNGPTDDEEEWRKLALSWLHDNAPVIIIDNVVKPLDSPNLNSCIASPEISGRLLSTNDNITVANRAVWFASGINIRVGDDAVRRCIKCRLDAHMERPHERANFAIEGGVDGFYQWTLEHRAELIAACLTLMRNWFALGKPKSSVTPIGSFEGWTTVIGGILDASGISDFLANLKEDGQSSMDDITLEWKSFIEAIYSIYEDKPITTMVLAKRMLDSDTQAELLLDTLPTSLTKSFDSYRKSLGLDRDFANHLGNTFRTRKGQMYGTLRLDTSKTKAKGGKAQWQVTDTSKQVPSSPKQITPLEEIESTLSTLIKIHATLPVCTAIVDGNKHHCTPKEMLDILLGNFNSCDKSSRERLINEAYNYYMPEWEELLTRTGGEF